jgi:hypothetical protein
MDNRKEEEQKVLEGEENKSSSEKEEVQTFHANPGVPTISDIPQKKDDTFTIKNEEKDDFDENEHLAPLEKNEIEEKASKQNKVVLILVAFFALALILIALLYMWGSTLKEEDVSSLSPVLIGETESANEEEIAVETPRDSLEILPTETLLEVSENSIEELGTEFEVLEEELDLLLVEE